MLILDNEISRARFAVHCETPYARLILDNEISRARFAVHLELTENRLILDNEITRARFVVHYESYTRGSTTFLVDSNKISRLAHFG